MCHLGSKGKERERNILSEIEFRIIILLNSDSNSLAYVWKNCHYEVVTVASSFVRPEVSLFKGIVLHESNKCT